MSHRPRKRFGQHFLHDPAVIERIIEAVAPAPGDALVEIGPGSGALTYPLAARCGALDVIELDRDLAPRLAAGADTDRIRVHQGDALRFDLAALAAERGRALRVIGNLPYNVATPLLFHVLDHAPHIRDMHFMLQKEVVERMLARPGERDYGRLAVMLAWRCRVTRVMSVGPGAFRPAPRVHSGVVRIEPHREPPFEVADPARFAEVVRRAFAQRRKTLRNALKGLVSEAGFEAAGIDPQRRAETLEPAAFAVLAAHARADRAPLGPGTATGQNGSGP